MYFVVLGRCLCSVNHVPLEFIVKGGCFGEVSLLNAHVNECWFLCVSCHSSRKCGESMTFMHFIFRLLLHLLTIMCMCPNMIRYPL